MTRLVETARPVALPRLQAGLLGRHVGFVALAAWAVAVLLVLTRGAFFWRDEWIYIAGRSFTDPASWLLPHAEHFVALHAAVYTGLVAAFGTGSYLPFLVVLFGTHIAFVAGIYVLIDRHVGRGPALAASAILLLLGSAALNLVWAFQMGAIGSGALALGGLVVIRERPGLAAALMTAGVATQGFALFLIPAATLYGWSRRALLACAVPVAAYGAWYVLIGRGAMVHYGPSTAALPLTEWLSGGVIASAEAIAGSLGPLALLGLPLLLRAPRRLAAVGVLALATEYALLGLARPGLNVPGGWQYIYFGAAFLLLVLASMWPAVPRLARPAVGVFVVVAVTLNVARLVSWSVGWPELMAVTDPLCSQCYGP